LSIRKEKEEQTKAVLNRNWNNKSQEKENSTIKGWIGEKAERRARHGDVTRGHIS